MPLAYINILEGKEPPERPEQGLPPIAGHPLPTPPPGIWPPPVGIWPPAPLPPDYPMPPGSIWPPIYPVDPGYGQGHPLPPHLGGGPVPTPPPGGSPPERPQPGLPPHVGGGPITPEPPGGKPHPSQKFLVAIVAYEPNGGLKVVGYTVVDTGLSPGLPLPPQLPPVAGTPLPPTLEPKR